MTDPVRAGNVEGCVSWLPVGGQVGLHRGAWELPVAHRATCPVTGGTCQPQKLSLLAGPHSSLSLCDRMARKSPHWGWFWTASWEGA